MRKLFSRSIRVEQELQKKIAFIIQHSLNDPRINMLITVSKVVVSRDLSHAQVFVSFFLENQDKDFNQELLVLNQSTGYIRKLLCRDMRLRIMPNLVFNHDNSLINGNKISKILKNLSGTY